MAASGTSGAGRSLKAHLLGSEVMNDVTAYRVGNHQHGPEILQALRGLVDAPVSMSFTTMLAPMPRGLLATCTARLDSAVTTDALRGALIEAYAGEPFVRVLPPGRWPRTAATLGGNTVQLQVTADHEAGRAVVVAAIDNLCKGAAGQALQCANLMLGVAEASGLTSSGIAP